jgi:hypothetical protein
LKSTEKVTYTVLSPSHNNGTGTNHQVRASTATPRAITTTATTSSSTTTTTTMAFESDPEPVVGGTFNGTKILSMQVEESEKGLKWKKRFIMTLANGIIAIEDRYVERAPPEEDSKRFEQPYNEIPFPILPTKAELEASERQREREDREERKRQKEADKIKKEQDRERRRRREKEREEKERAQQQQRLLEEEEEKAAASEAAKSTRKRVSWGPIYIRVLPEEDYDPPKTDGDRSNNGGGGPRAVWKFPKDWDKPTDAAFWRAHEVLLFAPGDDPSQYSNSNDDPSVDDSLSLSGIWAYVPGSEQGIDSAARVGNGSSLISDTDGDYSESPLPQDLWVYPPGTDPPEDLPRHGVYIITPKSGQPQDCWPPPVDEEKKDYARVGSVNTPAAFAGNSKTKALPLTVYPRRWQKPKVPTAEGTGTGTGGIGGSGDGGDGRGGGGSNRDRTAPIDGEWTYPSDSVQDDADWAPVAAMMYPPGHSPPKEHEGLPQGLWATTEDLDPNSKAWSPSNVLVFQPGTDMQAIRDSGEFDNIVATGTWCYPPGALKKDWPPPTIEQVKQLRKVGRLTVPPIFQNSGSRPVSITVYSKWQKPSSDCDDDDDKDRRLVGRWSYPHGEEADDDKDWEPQDVLLYAPGEKAPSNLPSYEYDSTKLPKGLWAISNDTPDVVKVYPPGMEPTTEEMDADNVIFSGEWTYPVGALKKEWPPPTKEEASRLRTVGKLPIWSPAGQPKNWRPQNAHVSPQRALLSSPPPNGRGGGFGNGSHGDRFGGDGSSGNGAIGKGSFRDGSIGKGSIANESTGKGGNDDGSIGKGSIGRGSISKLSFGNGVSDHGMNAPRGVWKFNNDDEEPEDLDDWETQNVVMYPSTNEPDVANGQPSGFWGLHKDATPDEDGTWVPTDLLFYPPGKLPDEDCAVQGKWAYPPGRLNVEWPPITKQEAAERRKKGKVPKWNPSGQGDNWKPQGATVFPKRSAPNSTSQSKGTAGVWKYQKGKEPTDMDDWDPQEVMIYPKDLQPENLEEKPHGVWGIRNDAEPDPDTGDWKTDDIWFYGPGHEPEADCAIQGKWTYPPSQLDIQWPPTKSDFLSPKINVGKLSIPNMFSTSSQTPSAFAPRLPLSSMSSKRGKHDVPPVTPRRHRSSDDDDAIDIEDGTSSPTRNPRSPMSLYQSAFNYNPTKGKKKNLPF